MSKFDCEVAVVGAGPYGLSVAAHLREANIETKVFGGAMAFWRDHMPIRMKLRSSPTATDLADPGGDLTFKAYAAQRSINPVWPLPLATFIGYGEWFKDRVVPDLDTRMIERIDSSEHGFCLWFDDGRHMIARRVVMATGLAKQQYRPDVFSALPREYVSSSGDHVDMSRFRGKRVAVIGRGQSACEYAAFLSDAGADAELVSRGDVHWLGSETPVDRPHDLNWRLHRLMATKSGVGPFPFNWLAEAPGAVRRMPQRLRDMFNDRCLRPGATAWLKPGLAGVRTGPGRNIVEAQLRGEKIVLRYDNGSAEFDHVLLATGYRSDIRKLALLAPDLLKRISCIDGSPKLSTGFQSSLNGLHFVGSSSVMSYGPLMRFIAGAGYTARHLTQSIVAQRAFERKTENRNKSASTPDNHSVTILSKSKSIGSARP
jgi:lysine/ornithine N-monooxygenase